MPLLPPVTRTVVRDVDIVYDGCCPRVGRKKKLSV